VVGAGECSAPINSPYNDDYAFVTRDRLTMYFTSDRPGGKGGDDLWVSHRDAPTAPWGNPENIAVLNSSAADSLSVLNADEDIMFSPALVPVVVGSRICGRLVWSTVSGRSAEPRVRRQHRRQRERPALYKGKHHVTTLYFGSTRPGGLGDYDIYRTSTTDKDLANASFGPGVWSRNSAARSAIPACGSAETVGRSSSRRIAMAEMA